MLTFSSSINIEYNPRIPFCTARSFLTIDDSHLIFMIMVAVKAMAACALDGELQPICCSFKLANGSTNSITITETNFWSGGTCHKSDKIRLKPPEQRAVPGQSL